MDRELRPALAAGVILVALYTLSDFGAVSLMQFDAFTRVIFTQYTSAFDRSLDVQISRLRKMIEPDPSQPRYIQTVWGVGYVFVPDGAA